MATLLEAVRGDTFNGLNGYKRPLQSNPTRVPGNQPSFRGVTNQPGKDIRAPAIKSSANHPDRKTNVTIPYARVTPVETPADIGRLNEGDLAFCSKTRPGIPGYAHARMTRLAGVDALNRWQGPDNWAMKTEDGKYRYILKDAVRVGDDWRKVPFLGEWTLDGVVMSSDEKDSYYSKSRDGNLYNIAIQGPAMVNNGFLDSTLAPNQLTPYNQGQLSRFDAPLGGSYMEHRLEQSGLGKQLIEERFDFASDYKGAHYHLYPLQSFDREVRPMNELFCGLVATEYTLNTENIEKIKKVEAMYDAAEVIKGDAVADFREKDLEYRQKLTTLQPLLTNVEIARTLFTDSQASLNEALAKRARMESVMPPPGKRDAIQKAAITDVTGMVKERSDVLETRRKELADAQTAYDTEDAKEPKLKPVLGIETIRQAFDKADRVASDPDMAKAIRAKTAFAKMGWWDATTKGKTAEAPDTFAAFRWVFFTSQQAWGLDDDLDQGRLPGEPENAAKRRKTIDPYNNEKLRKADFRHMVGAYRLGKVIDCKAGKMPFMESGPRDTGFRVTANVNIEWRDWRALRRHFNSIDSTLQFGDALTGSGPWNSKTNANEKNALFQWPTKFVPDFSGDVKDDPNIPVNMDFLFTTDQSQLREMDYDDQLNILKSGAASGVEDDNDDGLLLELNAEPDDDGPLLEPNDQEGDDTDSTLIKKKNLSYAVIEARFKNAPALPELPANPSKEHLKHRASIAAHHLELFSAPVTYGEARAFLKGAPVSSVARFVQAPPAPAMPPPAPPAAAAPASTAAPAASSAAASSAASASAGPVAGAALPVLQVPSASGKKRRPGGTDVFSGIFGGNDDAPQPLNPAHRADAPSGSGSTGRSFQRRNNKGPGK